MNLFFVADTTRITLADQQCVSPHRGFGIGVYFCSVSG